MLTMPLRKTSVLAVDDDVRMLHLMQRILELEGYRVLIASSAETTFNLFDEESPDLVLLDIMLPDADGYFVCQRIREFSRVPIIMVTAKDSPDEKIQGLNSGADDYVTKPFSSKELVARVKAVLRRAKFEDEYPGPTFYSGDLVVDFSRHRVTLSGQEVALTATEYRLLSYLTYNAGQVITSDQAIERVWGDAYIGDTHLLQVNIARLRKKLGDEAKNPKYIQTKPGIGYMIKKM